MAKKKETTLTSWEAVDNDLRIMGEKEIQIQNLEGQFTVNSNKLKEVYEEAVSPLKAEIKAISENIELFAEANKAEFVKDRTRKLNFGVISYRISESLFIKNIKATVAALKNLKLTEYLRTKVEPDKDTLKGLDDATLVKIGVTRKKVDKISIEPNYEKICTTV